MLLSAEQISKTYGTRKVLDRVSLYLEAGQKLGVIGVNGTGKSTLLRILAGAEEPDEGRVSRDPNVRLNYLPQLPAFDEKNTVLEQVFAGVSPEARALAEYEAKTILTRLGVPLFEQRVGALSGGQRKRVALCSALACPCDVLILDEPTNHLDSGMVAWLEDELRQFKGALVMVTHDRYFLERVVGRMVEVEGGALAFYEGNYDKYLEQKALREEMAQASERKRQAILRREYQWVMQGPTARGTKSRERLERYEALKSQSGPEERTALELSAVSSRLGKKTVELHGVSKSFAGRTVLRDFDLMLLREDRIGVVGRNGSGKSTLLNLIAGRLMPDSGEVATGKTVRMGYFSQENPPMDPEMRVIDFVKEIGNSIETAEGRVTASQLLEQFLFPADEQWAPIGKLSGGERRRLFLLSILAAAPNVLLLDEPTNDLDIQTLTILEDYLETFPGAVIAVSHDRYFLDKTVRRIFEVGESGAVTEYVGNYTDYLDARKAEEKREKTVSAPAEKRRERPSGSKKLKFSYKEQREYENIDGEIAALEEQLAQIRTEQEAKASDYVALQALQSRESELEAALEEKMERWVYLNDLAEQIAGQAGRT
ncbi:ABC-F family ATP-binding cassette domain-containing protein [Intestinimonas butyriciproducens]|uniref:ABC-F family ATP-binding cassette domain-containing protein n=1 Tax=Intestinimonas butyriciproducens TaxID=1297617 RepID=UPI0018986075|nr:ABC-F family ATP-binding cassette domain-containing protein [Intestinimonas butyriciproducens]MCI6364013.1 ABC-F family ATP-binding cassette domain-containing protein [Intestinimonas butyriciproducens]MDB7830805.1 ABC-F family ATP-binding cassette domain-containing protein [Intestinimonas butyriciproducens]MDY3615779.1 ABC-F family ATP-binding cassette domain-containing protein [Intestinimonas butyriciproducens]